MRIVIAPQSFKSSVSALTAAQAIERGVKRALPDCETFLVPVADGGTVPLTCWSTAPAGRFSAQSLPARSAMPWKQIGV